MSNEHREQAREIVGKAGLSSLSRLYDAIAEALAARDAEKWQPIETAPKDGEWQLVARFNGQGAMLWWLRAQWHLKRSYWWTSGGACEPTHWLRVPLELQSPELQEEKGEASKNDRTAL